jgi:hypothetical protein
VLPQGGDFVPPAFPPQQFNWVPDEPWSVPLRRNNVIFESQPPPLPLSDAAGVAVSARAEVTVTPTADDTDEVAASFQDVLRLHAEQAAAINRLRDALPTSRIIGPRHNQGPPLLAELDDESKHLLALHALDKRNSAARTDCPCRRH